MASRSFKPAARLRRRRFRPDPMADAHGDMPRSPSLHADGEWHNGGKYITRPVYKTRTQRIVTALRIGLNFAMRACGLEARNR